MPRCRNARMPRRWRQMQAMLRAALAAGAIGLSSSATASHVDGDGNPVPSRSASEDELLALCAVVAEYVGTQVEYIPCGFPDFGEQHTQAHDEDVAGGAAVAQLERLAGDEQGGHRSSGWPWPTTPRNTARTS